MKVRNCELGEPNRSGEPKITASDQTMSSPVAAGRSLVASIVGRPRRILRERLRIAGLGDVPDLHLGPGVLGRRGDPLGHRRTVPGRGVIDDREFGHGDSLGTS